MRILYLDCFSGISGDMMVGALADLGVTPSTFEWELSNIDIGDHHLHFERQMRRGIAGVKFDVHGGATHLEHGDHDAAHVDTLESSAPEDAELAHHDHHHHGSDDHSHKHQHSEKDDHDHDHHHHGHHRHDVEPGRSYSAINELINTSELSPFVKQHANSIFRRIAEAEAKIHGIHIDAVQFHEVGALDSIVDVVLTCIGLESLKIEQIYFSELVDGTGTIHCDHGNYPLPAPATLEILKGLPIRQIPVPAELITPTGAAIVAEFQSSIGAMPRIRPQRIGYGLGTRDLGDQPNVLRAVLADLAEESGIGSILEVQANIDDSSPEILGATLDRLLKAGAVDAYFTSVQMKKNRPGVLLTALCSKENLEAVEAVIFRETTTFGIRYRESQRVILDREQVEVETEAGTIQVKIGRFQENLLQVSPEFESCRILAEKSGLPLRRVYELAIAAYWAGEANRNGKRSQESGAGS
jgi:uncharacterized protein (TIGR00299 family) protein